MRRRLLVAVGVTLVGVLACLGWAGWKAIQARQDLTTAQAQIRAVQADVRAGQLENARNALPHLRQLLARAGSRVDGPAWSVSTHVPVLGGSYRAVQDTARAADLVAAQVLPPLVDALDTARNRHLLRDHRVDLAVIRQLQSPVQRAARASERARSMVDRRRGWLLPALKTRYDEARGAIDDLDDNVQTADRALGIAPQMLGADRPQRYFVAVQNNAEARATGGLIGAFAILTADQGTLKLERTGIGNQDLTRTESAVVTLPGAASTWQDIGSTKAWFDANLTPHFPDVAQTMSALWQHQSGQQIDGVIGLDPVVMSTLLQGQRAITLPGGGHVDAANIVDFVCRREYVDYPSSKVRKPLLRDLATEVFNRVVAGGDAVGTFRRLAKAGGSGHLYLWTRHEASQRVLASEIVGGALPPSGRPYLSVLTQNFGGNKLDYFIRREISVTSAREGGIHVVVKLTNQAPLGLPLYMTVRSDRPDPPVPYGTARINLAVYAAGQSVFSGATIDGSPILLSPDTDHGLALGTTTVEVARGRTLTVAFDVSEPSGTLTYRQQPLARADVRHLRMPHLLVGS
ncbi:MAG: DUF4012 domain-containing protein [Mycobacteriales bacterium]